ncbi:hypothetical protein JCM8097_007031 [Rhodosporidiobolus ruineniae]
MPAESTILAASLSSIFGTLALFLAVAFARYKFRQRKSRRAQPVDPKYEATVSAADGDGQAGGKEAKRWFGGAWGVTPVAEAGPGGTKQYLSGWFGLDAPSTAGWSAADTNDDFASPYGSNASTYTSPTGSASSSWRESHFSRASRASRRAAIAASKSRKSDDADVDGDEKEQDRGSKGGRKLKKKPRVSRTTELGMLERDDDPAFEADEKQQERAKLKVEEMDEVDLGEEKEGEEGEQERLTAATRQ